MNKELDPARMPEHIAIVMDGNGRWAKKRHLPRVVGHTAGLSALKEVVRRSSDIGVHHLTVFAFSTENWKRPKEEIKGIFKLLIITLTKELQELHENNVQFTILGDYHDLPQVAVNKLEEAIEKTKNNTGMKFHIALNYGGRMEIVRGVQALCRKAAAGEVDPEALTEADLSGELFTAGIPDPDLMIRTSGEMRLSNFLLWQSAYSEFIFTDTLWPDFTPERLEDAIREYQSRDRRFGGV